MNFGQAMAPVPQAVTGLKGKESVFHSDPVPSCYAPSPVCVWPNGRQYCFGEFPENTQHVKKMKETNEDIEFEIEALEHRKSKLLRLAQLKREVCELEKKRMYASDHATMVQKVAIEVCQKFNVTFDRLAMKCRENAVAVPRQVIFYIARELSDIRLAELGRIFNKDHGTVLYGHRSVKDRMSFDKEFAETIEQLMQSCRQRLASESLASN